MYEERDVVGFVGGGEGRIFCTVSGLGKSVIRRYELFFTGTTDSYYRAVSEPATSGGLDVWCTVLEMREDTSTTRMDRLDSFFVRPANMGSELELDRW